MFSSVILYPQANDLQLLRSPYYVTAPHSHSHIQEEREREREQRRSPVVGVARWPLLSFCPSPCPTAYWYYIQPY